MTNKNVLVKKEHVYVNNVLTFPKKYIKLHKALSKLDKKPKGTKKD